jgi:hypothetical protein
MARWEELVGDTTELAEASEAQLRRTMVSLLQHPTQHGLPPWPRVGGPGGMSPVEPTARNTEDLLGGLGRVNAPAPEAEEGAEGRSLGSVPQDGAPNLIYQLDMLSGELIPQSVLSRKTSTPPSPRPRSRKRAPSGSLSQLPLFPDEASPRSHPTTA